MQWHLLFNWLHAPCKTGVAGCRVLQGRPRPHSLACRCSAACRVETMQRIAYSAPLHSGGPGSRRRGRAGEMRRRGPGGSSRKVAVGGVRGPAEGAGVGEGGASDQDPSAPWPGPARPGPARPDPARWVQDRGRVGEQSAARQCFNIGTMSHATRARDTLSPTHPPRRACHIIYIYIYIYIS